MYETSFSPKVIRPFHLDKDVLDNVLTFLQKNVLLLFIEREVSRIK